MTAVAAKKFKTANFYNYRPILSHNGTYNFIVGARGLGKTWGAKRQAITNAIKKGEQFIYLRRYHTELSTRSTFFADIADQFPDYEFRVSGEYAQMTKAGQDDDKKKKWVTIGFFIALSKAQSKKSVAYPNVTMILFDEFIIEKGAIHYLPQEAKAFNDFYSTVDRWRDKTRVFFLANSLSIMNPYFLEYDIRPARGEEWIKSHEGFIVAHFPNSEAFAADVYKTRFGKFIKATDYADYSVGSQFADNNDALIAPKTPEAKYSYTLETKTGVFSVWIDVSNWTYYIQEKRPKQEFFWTMLPERMSEDKLLVTYSDKSIQYVRSAYSRGKVFFSSPQARNAFVGVFNR
jgi:hypothetical protein